MQGRRVETALAGCIASIRMRPIVTYLTRGFVFHPSNTFSGCSGVARTRLQMDHTQTDRYRRAL